MRGQIRPSRSGWGGGSRRWTPARGRGAGRRRVLSSTTALRHLTHSVPSNVGSDSDAHRPAVFDAISTNAA